MADSENNKVDQEMSNEEMEEFLRNAFNREFGDESEIPYVKLHVANSAFGNRIREFELVNFGYKDIEDFLINAFDHYKMQIDASVNEFKMIKTLSCFNTEFERAFVSKDHGDPLFEKRTVYIPTKMKEIGSSIDIKEHFQSDIIDYIKIKMDEVMVEESGVH